MRKQFYSMMIVASMLIAALAVPSVAAAESNATGVAEQAAQQVKTVKGKVVDKSGNPILGANVMEVGTYNGTVTDIDGEFVLDFKGSSSKIVVSSIGYSTTEIAVQNNKKIEVVLNDDNLMLDEVIVTGYSSQKKSDLTGAVSIVEVDDLTSSPVASVDEMMQGKLSGVNVISDNMPGGGVAVRIRGYGTIRNNDPLYIIDGVPVESGINFVNPNDIESMQVLKDASSASIYGARAANGVVIITTKKGREGKISVSLDAYYGIQTATNLVSMLNAQEFGDLLWIANENDGKTPSSSVYGSGSSAVIPEYLDATTRSGDVDWVDEVIQNAVVQSYNISIMKADEKSNSLFSLGYFSQDGLIKYTNFERVNARINNEYKLFNDRLTVGQNASISHSWGSEIDNNSALGGILYDAMKTVAITPVYDETGEFASNPLADIENPMGQLYRNKDKVDNSTRIFGNVYADFKIMDGLSFRSNFGVDYQNEYSNSYSPAYSETNTTQALSELVTSNEWQYNWVMSNTLNYVTTIDKHTIGAILGTEATKSRTESFWASREGFASDEENFQYLDAGETSVQLNGGTAESSQMLSFFGKVDYNYDNRYLLAFTLRRDGSSKLGNNKWGSFPAASAGWRISNEEFFSSNLFSNLKLRVGWGQNGNSDIPAYSSIDSYSSNANHSNYAVDGSQNSVTTGYVRTRFGNPDLVWETTTQTNIGIDMGFLDNSLTVVVDLFNKDTKDLLWERSLIGTVGGTNEVVWDNVGSMNNRGVEIEVSYSKQFKNGVGFNASLNTSIIKNELTELDDAISYLGLSSSELHSVNFDQEISRVVEGQAIGSFYGYVEDGLFQSQDEINAYVNDSGELLQPYAQPGDIKFVDVNDDGTIDSDDRDFIGNALPDVTFGLNLGASYKGFDLSLFFYSMIGNEVYDLTRYTGDFFNQSQYNKNSRTLDAWSEDNPDGTVPRLSTDDLNNNIRVSSYYVQDASFLKLKNIKLGYTLPKSVLGDTGFEKVYVYAQVTNPFTITGYDGMDPEVGLQNYTSDNRNLDMGVDRGIYPSSRTFTLGVNLNF